MHVKFEPGFDVGLRIGDRMGPWRFEGQFDYTDNGFKFPSDETGYSSGTLTYAALVNVIYASTSRDWAPSRRMSALVSASLMR